MKEVKGYQPQNDEKVDLVNKFKDHEEKLGQLYKEALKSGIADPRMLAIGKTQAQQSYMWLNRAIFQPKDFFNE